MISTEKRVQFNTIIKNQFPGYVDEEYPLSKEFFSQYYKSQEYQGSSLDILQNIDKYVKLDANADVVDSTKLVSNVDFFTTEIFVANTNGFPDSYGLLKIDNEVITYTGKTTTSFTGCVRGFSGITSYFDPNNPEQFIFSSSEVEEHVATTDDQGQPTKDVKNLSVLFLKEFFRKLKYQVAPGFENRKLYDNELDNPSQRIKLNQSLFIKQLKDFYNSRGTDLSFEILFKALYNEDVKVVKPRDYLFRPSDAHYKKTKDFIVEAISGNPLELRNSTLFQDEYNDIPKAYAPITSAEKIYSDSSSDYYKLSIDSGYNKDIIVDGSLYGNFSAHPHTKVIGSYDQTSTFIDVDSTVGFPTTGSLRVVYSNGSTGKIDYTSKNLNQFLGCTNISGTIPNASNIGINTYAYGRSVVDGSEIRVRVTPVIEKFNPIEDYYYIEKGDNINIKTLGVDPGDKLSNNWFLNIAPTYDVQSFTIINTSNNIGLVVTKTPSVFRIGDRVSIIDSNNNERQATVTDVNSENTFSILGQGFLPSNGNYKIRRNILKSNSPFYPSTSVLSSNVQNVYKGKDADGNITTLIASPSIPNYNNIPLDPTNKPIIFSGQYPPVGLASTDVIRLKDSGDHGLYTGDAVYYTPEKRTTTSPEGFTSTTILSSLGDSFDEGLYFVERVDQYNVRLARSRSDIFYGTFVEINSNVSPFENRIQKYNLRNQTLESQKLLRQIILPSSLENSKKSKTLPGQTGIFINGVELLNYKSSDVIYYGEIKEVEVVAPGEGYDVINPPSLLISDRAGVGATGFCSVNGFLEEIRIIDGGFDYTETPVIKITGGNGNGAVAAANMKLIDHKVSFNSQQNANLVGVGTTISTIGFGTYHKFRNGEKVQYTTNGQTEIGGLVDNSIYYVSVLDSNTVKVYKTESDALSGLNTISITSYGIGNHTFKSINKKSVLSSIQVISPGSNYQNKKRTINPVGVNTYSNIISIPNHGYETGEIIKYTSSGSPIGGLNNNEEYYLSKVDKDSFRLSLVGSGSTLRDYYFNTREYVNLNSVGVGTHEFNYPEISVEVIGSVGIASVSDDLFKAVVQPIFRGQLSSVYISNPGVGYGSSEIINFERDATYTFKNGQGAQLTPIVSAEGKIIDVLINQSGSYYFAPPNLEVFGDGIGAVLTPIISNGQITSVKIIEPGLGYSPNSTSINVIVPGKGAELKSKLQTWTINNFARNINSIKDDDGVLVEGINDDYGLQYTHLYCPRKLREVVYSSDESGKTLYGITDLRKSSSGEEIDNITHSPIIGWAYDGNPIYGPYGYERKTGGTVRQVRSSYIEEASKKKNRPPLSIFPPEFFVEDFTYINRPEDTFLDENNGRFCVTPEFPGGVYAYFVTVNSSPDSSGTFSKYKRPVFPYVIGENFHSNPIEFNFKKDSNQDFIDLNDTNWRRNTRDYQINSRENRYTYVDLPQRLNQKSEVKFASPGLVESVGITSEGINYQIGDSLVFDNTNTGGVGAAAKVSRLKGKNVSSISVASSSISNVDFYPSYGTGSFLAIAQNPHSFATGDIISISGLSTTTSSLEGFYRVGVTTGNTYILSVGVGSTAITGLVTFFQISGDLTYPNLSENDILQIEDERVKVLNVDQENSRIRVLRSIDGSIGVSHTNSTVIYQNERKLKLDAKDGTNFNFVTNRQIYFNPSESVAIGTNFGVGIGVTIVFSNPGFGITQIFTPTKTIYIPNHSLNTGDSLIYSSNGGVPIGISTNGITTSSLQDNDILYVAKISDDLIGVSTVKVGLGTTGTFVGISSTTSNISTLFFTSYGSGVYHSFKTDYENVVSGNISRNLVTVSTAETHGLRNNDTVFINVNPSISTSVSLIYNDYSKRIVVDPKDFSSVGIDTLTGTITINNHGYYSGEKVIHTTDSPTYGLENNEIYYVIVVDENRFKLSSTYNNAVSNTPTNIGITSSYSGKISKVNPPIKIYRDSLVIFDLSDPSLSFVSQSTRYPAFELNFYLDKNFTQKYDSSNNSNRFNVSRYGTVGISTNARVELEVNSEVPANLFYKFDLINEEILTDDKKLIIVDDLVLSYNELHFYPSDFNGEHKVTVSSVNSFNYSLTKYPEKSNYSSTNSIIEYETNSQYAYGGISSVRITNRGVNYYSLPGISTEVTTSTGSKAIFEAYSTSIGSPKTYKVKDIGFDFPTDFTLRPTAKLPQICKIDPLSSFVSIGVTYFGRGYISAPDLIVLDGKTGNIVDEVDLHYNLGDSEVEIRKNAYGLNNVRPTILPVNNSNGIGIGTIIFNEITKDVTIGLSTGFSTQESFPFAVNDKVLIENVTVSGGSTVRGYNSKNYNYQLFTLTSVTENIGGIGSVTYNLSEYLQSEEIPGTYNPINFSGRIIPEKHLIKFNSILKDNSFIKGESIISSISGDEIGIVGSWNDTNNILKVESSRDIVSGDILKGGVSFTNGLVKSVIDFDSEYIISDSSIVEGGWDSNAGFLSDNLQRIQDNDYYQKFSYSLKSRVDYDTWKDPVTSLNHTAGFKKFSDLQLESQVPERDSTRMMVKIPSQVPEVEIVTDAIGVVNLNCVYDFDLARENSFTLDLSNVSDEIIFENKILTDFTESIGNRVLLIDDIGGQFNSYPRPTKFTEVSRFYLDDARSKKYVIYVRDRRFIGERQLILVTLLYDQNGSSYINQYGRVETQTDLGSFDFYISGLEGVLTFYPNKFSVNDYNISALSYNVKDIFTGIGTTNLGNSVLVSSSSTQVSAGSSSTIVSIPTSYTSAKVILEISGSGGKHQFDEFSIIHDGSNIEFLSYGQLTNHSTDSFSSIGLGTYYPYFSGSNINVDFHALPGIALTVNSIKVSIGNSTLSGVGTITLREAQIGSSEVSIAASTAPVQTDVISYPDTYDGGYFIAQVSDITNNRHQISELIVVDDYVSDYGTGETYFTEFGNLETSSGLGTFETRVDGSNIVLAFTPISNIDVEVKCYYNTLAFEGDEVSPTKIDFTNSSIETDFGIYTGTEGDIRRSFNLQHKVRNIFQRDFLGNSTDIVDLDEDTIEISEHYFVTGEEVIYTHSGAGTTQAIGITTTDIPGIGFTDKLPASLYIIKVDDTRVKVSASATDALSNNPVPLDIVSVGIGTSHTFTSKNQNQKVIVSIDNIIQSPIVSTALTTTLSNFAAITQDVVYFSGITSFFGGNLIKVNDEIMRISSVGIGSTNAILVKRGWMGTVIAGHATGSLVTKVEGNYNIVDNTINFVEAPYGNIPLSSTTNPPDERDWTGITTHSKFHGRVFLRSGVLGSSEETYAKNYIFDDISENFNGLQKDFTLKSNSSNVSGIEDENAIILINDIFQGPGISYDYNLSETSGITTITFTGTASSVSYDPNNSSVPVGGVIVSVGSTEGFGYQPLISAGGTSTVSVGGTIESISIGNSGSGYRGFNSYQIYSTTSNEIGIGSTVIEIDNKNSIFKILELNYNGSNATVSIGTYINSNLISVGSTSILVSVANTSEYQIPTNTPINVTLTNPQIGFVNVSVGKTDLESSSIEHVGIATILDGHVLSPVYITNPGSDYVQGISTISNSPYVVFDSPRSYSDIPLIYSSISPSGVGTQATIDIVVGQGSSVTDFEIKYLGYGYGQGEILTIPVGGVTGIPTTSGFKEFQVSVQRTYTDKFTGWSLGQLQVIDNLDDLFDGRRVVFPIKVAGNLISIRSSPGSNLDIESTLLIFINDILQVPGEGYVFDGGSVITFSEAPKPGDKSKVIFYRGTGSVDVIDRDIAETVKIGDELILGYDASVGQSPTIQEEARTVTSVNSTDLVKTNLYFGPGNITDETLARPVVWCRQTEDKIINGQEIAKDRQLYESNINPFAYVINTVGIGSTIVYVDNLRPFFNPQNENDTNLEFQNQITLISQDTIVSASATAVVSVAGTISSIVINESGVGYSTTPIVSIASTNGVGVGTITTALAQATISSGSVTSINITNPGSGYTTSNPPLVLISSPRLTEETNTVSNYFGDSGVIVGFGTTTQSAIDKLILDFYIPEDSFLRDSQLVGTAVTISGISSGDYFVVYNSNVGYAGTSLDVNNNTLGFGTQFVDNVYQVDTTFVAEDDVVGVGTTYVRRVYARIVTGAGIGGTANFSSTIPSVTFDSVSPFYTFDGTSNVGGAFTGVVSKSSYFGEFSWGRIEMTSRSSTNTFNSYIDQSVGGISTSAIVQRTNPLKFNNYLV